MKKLPNYLRAFRKRSGLSQEEVAFLLGAQTDSVIWLYEAGRRIPGLVNLICLEQLFGSTGVQLYAGVADAADRKMKLRARRLVANLGRKPYTLARERKLKFMRDFLSGESRSRL